MLPLLRLACGSAWPATKAQALVPGLVVHDADPEADAEALERLALWALRRYAPIVAADPPDGLVIDTTGADHLHGGEKRHARRYGRPACRVRLCRACGDRRQLGCSTRVGALGRAADACRACRCRAPRRS